MRERAYFMHKKEVFGRSVGGYKDAIWEECKYKTTFKMLNGTTYTNEYPCNHSQVWEDEITKEKTQSEHLRNEDGSLNTIRNRLYNKTLNFYVRWRVSENDNITYEIDGDVS